MLSLPRPEAVLATLRTAPAAGLQLAIDQGTGLVQQISDQHLEWVMNSPLRRPIVEAIFLLMPRYLDRTRASALNLAVRWTLTGSEDPDQFDLVIEGGRCRVIRGGGSRRPLVTITVESVELLRLALGRSNPMQAYFAGRLVLRGDVMQAARLTSLFRVPPGVST